MQYLLLIHSDEKTWSNLSEEESGAVIARYGETLQAMQEQKVLIDAHRLHPSDTATTVRVRDGELMTTDGPFTELKEQLGGFFLIEAPDLDAAIGWARRLPGSEYGSIEVRPVWQDESAENS